MSVLQLSLLWSCLITDARREFADESDHLLLTDSLCLCRVPWDWSCSCSCQVAIYVYWYWLVLFLSMACCYVSVIVKRLHSLKWRVNMTLATSNKWNCKKPKKEMLCVCHFLVLLNYLLFITAALCNRAGHYIFDLWFLSSIYLLLSFFLA